MKTILIVLAVMIGARCYTEKIVQTETIRAKLIKIDTIHGKNLNVLQQQQQLTWRDADDIEYVTFAPLQESYPIGTRMIVSKER